VAVEHTGATVLGTHLISTGLVTKPSENRPWPIYFNSMPEMPNEAFTIYDIDGDLDGREMPTGRTVEHPGFQVRMRSSSSKQAEGIVKMFQIQQEFDRILKKTVPIVVSGKPTKNYLLQSVKRTTPILPLGPEEGGSRELFTTNGTITYGEKL
jgi:hypothetical protein